MSADPVQEQSSIVYGHYQRDDAFIIFEESDVTALAEEIEAVMACETVGEARKLQETLSRTYLPGGDLEDGEGEPLPDDAPYDWTDTGEAQEGEWPPMAGGYALGDLPVDLLQELAAHAGGHLIHTMSGSSFVIPLDREDALRGVLRSVGYEFRRDDGLVNSLNPL